MDDFGIKNEVQMDQALEKLGKSFTMEESWEINRAAVKPFHDRLKEYYANHRTSRDYENEFSRMNAKRAAEGKDPLSTRQKLHHMADTLVINKDNDGSVSTGFSKVGKKAYIARFINDGWDVRNQYGGPYTHVEGKHYWEKTQQETENKVKSEEKDVLLKVMHKRGLS